MTKASSLEEAIYNRDRLRAIRVFRRRFDDWSGAVEISFDSLRATISRAARDELDRALSVEEQQLRNILAILDVVMDEGGEPL